MGRRRKSHKHLPQRVYLRSGSYYFVDYLGKWHNLGRNYATAMAAYGQIADHDSAVTNMEDLIDRYLREIAPKKAESTFKDNIKQAKYLRAAFGKLRPVQIKAQGIYAYLDARGKRSRVQANRELALLSHIFKYAIRWGAVDRNPCIGVERFKETPRDCYVEDWEYLAFREFGGPLIAAYIDFKLLTGLRKGDVLCLKIEHLKEDGIHAHISKTNKDIIIAWSDALREAVTAIRSLPRPSRVTGLYLFCTRHGKPYAVSGFSSIWQRRMKAALEAGVLKERFTDHDLRAKSGSDTDLDHAASLLTHLDARTTQRHYRRKTPVVRPLK